MAATEAGKDRGCRRSYTAERVADQPPRC